MHEQEEEETWKEEEEVHLDAEGEAGSQSSDACRSDEVYIVPEDDAAQSPSWPPAGPSQDGAVHEQHRDAVVEHAEDVDGVKAFTEGEKDQRIWWDLGHDTVSTSCLRTADATSTDTSTAFVDDEDHRECDNVDLGEDVLRHSQILSLVREVVQTRVNVEKAGGVPACGMVSPAMAMAH